MSVSIETTNIPTAPMTAQPVLLGQNTRMPEFSLAGKVILVSGAGRGLGLTQSEALLEAGAKVYALDRLEEPAAEFVEIQQRARELGTELHYRRIDVRDTELLNSVIEGIANVEGRMDGLVAAAGIQQETSALDYSAKDSNTMFEVNVTGVFMTAQAVAKQMIRFGNGGSIAMIASMSGTIVNRVCCPPSSISLFSFFPFAIFLIPIEWDVISYPASYWIGGSPVPRTLALPLQSTFRNGTNKDNHRASFVLPTTPLRLPSFNWAATSLPNGASTTFASTLSPPVTSSPPWLRSYSSSSLSAVTSGPRRICSAVCLVRRNTEVQQSSCSLMPHPS